MILFAESEGEGIGSPLWQFKLRYTFIHISLSFTAHSKDQTNDGFSANAIVFVTAGGGPLEMVHTAIE